MKPLEVYLGEYLQFRRSTERVLKRTEFELRQFLKFLKTRRYQGPVTEDRAIEWATKSGQAKGQSGRRRLVILRKFLHYVRLEDPRHEVPRVMAVGSSPRRKKIPYVYKQEDILRLMELASKTLRYPMTCFTYQVLLGLLACTGMRVSEAIGLNLEDFSESQESLFIKCDKRSNERIIVLHATTVKILVGYQAFRRKQHPCGKKGPFFVSHSGERLHYNNVSPTVQRLLKKIGLYADNNKPTIHDLRHTFAINTVRRWYQEGLRVENRLVSLASYLGHSSPNSTYWYLTATEELMNSIKENLEQKLGELL